MKPYINPYKLEVYPVVVLSCDMVGFIPWVIRAVTRDNWNHVMESRQYGAFVSQNAVYKEIPFDKYMNKFHKLKIWTIKDMTEVEKLRWNAAINKDLAAPLYRRVYDFLGIAGHLLGVRWLQAPLRNYCSERVRKHLVDVFYFDMQKHPTPADIDNYLEAHPRGELIGFWDAELAISGDIKISM